MAGDLPVLPQTLAGSEYPHCLNGRQEAGAEALLPAEAADPGQPPPSLMTDLWGWITRQLMVPVTVTASDVGAQVTSLTTVQGLMSLMEAVC